MVTMLPHRSAPYVRAKKVPRAHLTDLSIRALKPGTWFDEKLPAFGIRVGKLTKTWIVMRTQKRIRTVIGHYPAMSLADARQKARALLLDKPEPKEPRITFAEARAAYLAQHNGRPRTVKELTRLLTKHFDDGPLDKVKLPEGLRPSEALHAFRAIRAMMRWCVRPPHRYLTHNPFDGYAPQTRDGKRTRLISDLEVKTLLGADRGQSGAIVTLMLLWGTRKGETLALRRDWIADGVLTIPGHITKNGRPHTIPILPYAQSILDTLPSPYLFPGKNGHLHDGSWTKLHRTLQKNSGVTDWTAHDCRRTFRSVCARLGVRREIAERLLNHAQGELDEIYDHHSYLPEKENALALVESWLTSLLKT